MSNYNLNYLVLGTIIFALSYIGIITDKIHRTIVALVGATLMLLLKVINQKEAFNSIDFNTIFLLIGMMIIVNISKKTGIFQYLAIKSVKISRGEPLSILVSLSVITAIMAAFMDAVTAVLLIGPVTLLIADSLEINPVPFLISEGIAANIGGTATMVGDPPNVMIGSAANLGFMSFVRNLTPVVIVILFFFALTIRLFFKKELKVESELKHRVMDFNEKKAITDHTLMKKSLFVLGLTVLGFVVHESLGLQPATIAIAGASLLLLISNSKPDEILREIEWPTLFFFMGLFIVVGGVVKVGLIKILSMKILHLTEGNLTYSSFLILWFSAFASSVIDNVPFVATMIPLIKEIGHHMNIMPLWWSLSLGACLGGNGTLIGTSSNVALAGISERHGYPITFKGFLKYGMPLMIESIIISSIYIYFRYLR